MLKSVSRSHIAGTWLLVLILGMVLVALGVVRAQTVARYRAYVLGSSVAEVAEIAQVRASSAKVVHERPALIQTLEWSRPFAFSDDATAPKDPVERIVFSFYNDQLFQIAVDYDRRRTEGMTDADMVAAISAEYGTPAPSSLKERRAETVVFADSGSRLARWGDAEHPVTLYRSAYLTNFRLTLTASGLDALARKAEAEAVRLDERDAPSRAIARQKQDEADALATQEKARVANKAAFRP
jgi:hypothetical protein